MLESHPLSFYIPWRGSFTLYERSFLNDRKFLYARPFFPQSFTRKEKEKKESHGWKNHTPLELDLISIDSKIDNRFEIDHFLDNYAQIKQISFRLSMTS